MPGHNHWIVGLKLNNKTIHGWDSPWFSNTQTTMLSEPAASVFPMSYLYKDLDSIVFKFAQE